jgi:hypothetical protein
MAAGVAAALALVALVNPGETRLFPPCVFHALTGLHCPGCGSLRALHRLLHGDLAGALRFNPLTVISPPVLALLAWRKDWAARPAVAWTALAVLLLYGVLRNIPAWPLSWLAPG